MQSSVLAAEVWAEHRTLGSAESQDVYEYRRDIVVALYQQLDRDGATYAQGYRQRHVRQASETHHGAWWDVVMGARVTVDGTLVCDRRMQAGASRELLRRTGTRSAASDSDSWVASLERLQCLEQFLLPLLKNDFRKSPYVPLLLSILILFNYKDRKKIKCWKLMREVVTFPHAGGSHKEIVLVTVLNHLKHLGGASGRTLGQSVVLAEFLSACMGRCDKSYVRAVITPLVSDPLLRPLVRSDVSAEGTNNPFAVPGLWELVQAHSVDITRLRCGDKNENFLVDEFICPFVHHVRYFCQKVKQLGRDLSDGTPVKIRVELDDYPRYMLAVLALLVVITGQPTTGRYMSWFLAHWPGDKVTTPGEFRFFYFLDISKKAVAFVPRAFARHMETYVLQLESQVTTFLRMPNGLLSAFVPEARTHRDDPRYFSLLGMDTPYPDDQFIRDLVFENFMIPRLGIHFLDMGDYMVRNFVLFKANVALQIWRDFSEGQGGCLLRIQSFTPDFRRTLPHDGGTTYAGSILLPEDSSASVPLDASSIVFLVGLDETSGCVTHFRGCHFWKTETATLILVRLDEAFREWYTTKHDPHRLSPFTHIYFTEATLSSFTRVLQCLAEENFERMQSNARRSPASSTTFPYWLTCILTGPATEDETHGYQVACPGLPAEINMMGVLSAHTELLGILSGRGEEFTLTLGRDYVERCTLNLASKISTVVEFGRVATRTQIVFSPTQRQALASSLLQRITLIVGPPGTGKTDVMAMILRLFHRNLCVQDKKILLATHSNGALDQLVEKLTLCGVDVLRLGGQSTSSIAKGCTPSRRIEVMREDAWKLLKKYENAPAPVGPTLQKIARGDIPEGTTVESLLANLYTTSIHPVLQASQASGTDAIVEGKKWKWAALVALGHDLRFLHRVYGLLKLQPHEQEEALVKESALVAVTCGGAAMKHRLLETYPFDAVVIEEAGKILESESLLLLRQQPERVVLVGDDRQLTPLVRDTSLRESSNYDQSMFRRLRRLGVTPITLDQQGRARPEIADLYRWRYPSLSDMPHVKRFCVEIPGLLTPLQFVDISKGQTKGETNCEEAEFIVAFFAYLLHHGEQPPLVSILTPYREQKRYLRRCFARFTTHPRDICTVDEFQGMQNEVVLVSLVHTGSVPSVHLRDERRLTVLTSRAQRALFLFGRRATFEASSEWRPIFAALAAREHTAHRTLRLQQSNGQWVDVHESHEILTLVGGTTTEIANEESPAPSPSSSFSSQSDTSGMRTLGHLMGSLHVQ